MYVYIFIRYIYRIYYTVLYFLFLNTSYHIEQRIMREYIGKGIGTFSSCLCKRRCHIDWLLVSFFPVQVS